MNKRRSHHAMGPARPRQELTDEQFAAEIAAMERTPRPHPALDQASARALQACGEHWQALRGRVRIVRGWCPHGEPLPPDWAIPIESGEVPIALAQLPAPFVGFVALVARVADLPRPRLDDRERERIATALADALLQEVGQ